MKVLIAGSLLAAVSMFTVGCGTPTAEQDLNALAAALDVVSTLPNLTPADRAWIGAASNGVTCASGVLAKSEMPAQESIDIAQCFAGLPVVPAGDQPYIQAAIDTLRIFLALFGPPPTPAALSSNAVVSRWPMEKKQKYTAAMQIKMSAVRSKAGR